VYSSLITETLLYANNVIRVCL